jgi:hypothetical protein
MPYSLKNHISKGDKNPHLNKTIVKRQVAAQPQVKPQ